jgi:hypothetical protein
LVNSWLMLSAQCDGGLPKIPDGIPPGDAGERSVSREEASVGLNPMFGASLMKFPPLSRNPPVASVAPTGPTGANRTRPNNHPRKIKAHTAKGDAAKNGAIRQARPHLQNRPPVRSASTPTAPA